MHNIVQTANKKFPELEMLFYFPKINVQKMVKITKKKEDQKYVSGVDEMDELIAVYRSGEYFYVLYTTEIIGLTTYRPKYCVRYSMEKSSRFYFKDMF